MKNAGATILVLLTLCGSALGIEVLEPGYVAETYVTYSESGVEKPCAMTFDDNGNLYVVQREAWNTVGSV